MRSIAAALVGIALAAGASYAHGNRSETPEQVAGTLSCVTKPELSLIFGRSPVADCTFVAERGGFRQHYQAILSANAATNVATAQRIVWRVMTKDGFSRPAMLSGSFGPELGTRGSEWIEPRLAGRFASLKLVSHSGRSTRTFALSHPRIELAAVEPSLSR